METRKEIIKRMGDEMREEIYLTVTRRIQRDRRRIVLRKAIAIAASLAILVGIFSHYLLDGTERQETEWLENVSPMGERATVMLADGTKVTLNSATTMRYPAVFSDRCREVSIDGEAFFEVSKDKARPFIVSAKNLRVKVLGTKFNVKAYKEEREIEVTLQEGEVGVGLDTENLIRIKPGQQVSYSESTDVFQTTDVKAEDYTAWMRGNFNFVNQPLEQIARQLERHFNVRINIVGDELKKTPFTGDFVHGESLDQILRVMTMNRPIQYEMGGNQIEIRKR